MKKAVYYIVLLTVLLCGCSVIDSHEPISGEIEMVAPDFWPDNEFTCDLPRPDAETYWVLDESDINRYSMSFMGITEAESEDYVKALKSAGFSEYRRNGNNVSVGYILFRGDTYLSLSCSEGTMGFTIVIED
ncbi:MAG: hypothetical protein IKZ19_03295 [Clostridia bacterium]|nr:hypothetical protein [Clostridia bacterium]